MGTYNELDLIAKFLGLPYVTSGQIGVRFLVNGGRHITSNTEAGMVNLLAQKTFYRNLHDSVQLGNFDDYVAMNSTPGLDSSILLNFNSFRPLQVSFGKGNDWLVFNDEDIFQTGDRTSLDVVVATETRSYGGNGADQYLDGRIIFNGEQFRVWELSEIGAHSYSIRATGPHTSYEVKVDFSLYEASPDTDISTYAVENFIYIDDMRYSDILARSGGRGLMASASEPVHGGAETDRFDGGDRQDTVYGAQGKDLLSGGAGQDVLYGGQGLDYLEGNTGDDALYGNKGNDVLRGGQGGDTLNGGAEMDDIHGDKGNDSLLGGEGNDYFFFKPGHGHDVVGDFIRGQDKLVLSSELFATPVEAAQAYYNHVLVTGVDSSISFSGFGFRELEAGDIFIL
ncbi:MAG: hypothetical protein J0L97_10465 [Alphaproteobacteria bacterium]|nr:hypothetical protein [Alphaproteobacteria bacterium]